ncbi:MAG: vitamin K epoxide reductase family protein [Oligoflexus sp.]
MALDEKPHTQNHQDASTHKKSSHQGMGKRGVTRPMAMHQSHQNSHQDHQKMSMEQRMEMLQMHHQQTLWVYWSLIILGVWTILAPFTFGYLNEELWVNPSGGRGVWFSNDTYTELRALLMAWSDVISGLILCIFGWRSLTADRPISLWICCFVGVWLNLAPLIFWAPTAAAYYNDTIVGALIIALTILIPGMPNMIKFMQMGPATPKGWTYNPSSWPQRWIMIVFAFLGWIVSRYLAVYQLGYIDYVWDPFFSFENGTQRVLDSSMSHSWPVSDAALGAFSYTFEFLMGWMGSTSRWRTMPWMVLFFGILVIPLGLVHIVLVISQPVVVGYWCSMCLLAAILMLPMIPLAADEVVAMGQHMVQAKRRNDQGGSVWKIFWFGGSAEGTSADERSPDLANFPDQPSKVFKSSLWGMSFPFYLSLATVLGIGLMFVPTLLDVDAPASHIPHLAGALIVTVAVISMGEVLRIGRYLNLLICAIAGIAVWFVGDFHLLFSLVTTLIVIAVALLSLPRGVKKESYGTWDRFFR